MNLPWWAWLVLAAAVALFLLARSARSWRASIRNELLAFLAAEAPELEVRVVSEREMALRERGQDEEDITSLYLHNLLRAAARLEGDDRDGRRELYAHLLGAYREGTSALDLDPEATPRRLRPRLLTDADLERMAAEVDVPLVVAPLDVEGLHVAVVIDSEHSVAYLDRTSLEQIGLDAAGAVATAIDNLRPSLPRQAFAATLADGATTVIKNLDSYDAARLLVLPQLLSASEELVALIPDRDTLALAPLPADGDWSSLQRLATNAAGDPLWRRPLVVGSSGVRAAP